MRASVSAWREEVRLCNCACWYQCVWVSAYARVAIHSSCVCASNFYELHKTNTHNRKNLNLRLSKFENKNKILNSIKRRELLDNVVISFSASLSKIHLKIFDLQIISSNSGKSIKEQCPSLSLSSQKYCY